MKDGVWVQCARCGNLHQVKSRDVSISDDDLYTKSIFCTRCRDGTKHLLIGENQEDVYIYGNANLDKRYYIYDTK